MKQYIKSRSNIILALTLLIAIVVTMTATGNLLAEQLPNINDLDVVRYSMAQNVYEYIGEAYEPTIQSITFEDEDGKEFVADSDKIIIKNYLNNEVCGMASMEVAIKGYEGTITLDGAFAIQPERVVNLVVAQATREMVELKWNPVAYADGYLIYKSNDNGQNFKPIKKLIGADSVSFQDKDIQTNSIYKYYLRAYKNFEQNTLYGDVSETVEYYTPLDVAVLNQVQGTSFNSIQIQWGLVNGAVGYQVFKGNAQDGEYTCIAEIADGATITYTDTNCECGIPYFYYVKACQSLSGQMIYGENSNVMSTKTVPNRVSLSGVTSNGDTEVTLQWKKSEGAQGYEVYRSTDGSNYQLVKTIENADTLSYGETGLEKKGTYCYKIRPYAIIKGEKLFGAYSGIYEKVITIEYSAITSSSVSALTQYVGRPYKFGGISPTSGWDCSGFTQYVFKNHFGVSLPRTASQQAGGGKSVNMHDRASWQPGDLLFYKGRSTGYISHVAIYIGNGQMIHALSSRYGTLVQGVDYYDSWDNENTLVSVRRYFK